MSPARCSGTNIRLRTEAKSVPSPIVPAITVAGWLGPRRSREHRPHQRHHPSCQPPQGLAQPRPTKQTVAIAALSPAVHATTVVGWAHADQANRGQSSSLACRARNHSVCLSPRRTIEQRPQQSPQLSCMPPQCLLKPTPTERTEPKAAPTPVVPPPQGLAEPTPTERTEARAAPSSVVSATTVAD
jgi:hypothetical protein